MESVNFFWKGKNFNFLEKIVVQSHHKVGHKPIIWLSGQKPETRHWKEIEQFAEIKDADTIFDINSFLETGGNLRTGSSLWRWNFLYKFGGIYCDIDAFALKKFPDDPWIICSGEDNPELLSIGVLKAPSQHKIFLDCIKKTKKEWGNVRVFTDEHKAFFGHTNPTHNNELFYPYEYQKCKTLFEKSEIPYNSYSIHFYGKALEDYLIKSNNKVFYKIFKNKKIKNSLSEYDEVWCKENSNTLLAKLYQWLNTSK